jgi:hypothetical protein
MKVSRSEGLTQPYVLEATDLESICNRLQTWFEKFDFEITSKDSLKREFSSLADLLQFENPPSKDIQTLRISGFSEDIQTRVWLKFDKDLARNIFISFEGEEETTIAINELVEERLAAMKPWYAFLARVEAALLFWGLLLLIFLTLTVSNIFAGKLSIEGSLNITLAIISVASAIFGVVLSLVFNKLKLLIFPMGVFALGQGAKRHKDKEIIRTGVVIAFFISLTSSVIATLIFAL